MHDHAIHKKNVTVTASEEVHKRFSLLITEFCDPIITITVKAVAAGPEDIEKLGFEWMISEPNDRKGHKEIESKKIILPDFSTISFDSNVSTKIYSKVLSLFNTGTASYIRN